MSDTDPRIAVLQEQLSKTDLHPSERDALADELKTAHDINGDTAPVMQTLKTMLIQNVRRELIAHGKIKAHFANCVVAGAITEDENGKKVMPWTPEIQAAVKAITDTQKIDTESITSTLEIGKFFKLTGPVVKYAVLLLVFVGCAYLVILKRDEDMKKELKDTIYPQLMEVVKKAAIEK